MPTIDLADPHGTFPDGWDLTLDGRIVQDESDPFDPTRRRVLLCDPFEPAEFRELPVRLPIAATFLLQGDIWSYANDTTQGE